MLIGIDANEANVTNRVGSNEFAYQILSQLYWQDKTNQYLIYLKNKPLADLPPAKFNWRYRILTPKFLWTQWRLPLSLFFNQPKPYVFLTLGHYAPRFSPMPTMICIMDLAFLKFPQTFRHSDLWQLKLWTAYSIKQASHIFAISQATKNDIINSYGVAADKISVTYPGIDPLPVKGKSPIKGQYLLYVGTLQPRKNLDALIEAFASITPLRCDLVIAGKLGWKYKQRPVPNVKYLGYVPNEKLGALIKSAIGLVLPSLYEGFGIPVVQAMALGTPVLVSRNSSLPEIVGECGLYIEPPFGAPAIRDGLVKLLSLTPGQKQRLLQKAQQRSKQFSWENAAKTILTTIQEKLGK